MVFIISVGVDVVVVCEGGEVLRIEYSITVSVLFSHDFATGETSPLVESVPLVDYQFAPEMSIRQFDIFHILDESIRQVCLSSFDVLQEFTFCIALFVDREGDSDGLCPLMLLLLALTIEKRHNEDRTLLLILNPFSPCVVRTCSISICLGCSGCR